jgi:hypothetical protein
MIDFLRRKKRIESELTKANKDYDELYEICCKPDYDVSRDNHWWIVMLANIEDRIGELEREQRVAQKEMKYYYNLYGWSMVPPIANN